MIKILFFLDFKNDFAFLGLCEFHRNSQGCGLISYGQGCAIPLGLQGVDTAYSIFLQKKMQTSDRGKEFACFREIEAMGIPFYFAEAYSSWQRGANENSNSLLREFYPKGTLFSAINQEELDRSVSLINERPRKCLGFRSASEVFTQEISNL